MPNHNNGASEPSPLAPNTHTHTHTHTHTLYRRSSYKVWSLKSDEYILLIKETAITSLISKNGQILF